MISSSSAKWSGALALFLLIVGMTASLAQTNDRSILLPSTQKYKDTGVRDATGRSGNAVVAVRALLGKDRTTTLEITTSGDVDNPLPAPGSISKVQEKIFNDSDKLLLTTNYNSLASLGYVIQTSDSLVRHQTFQVQVNVDGIDTGTDVVTVHETVKLRPDLAVAKLLSPAKTRQNRIAVVNTILRELNGDVGAHADCVLYVDNGRGFAAVDTAPAIWIDAGGTVGCDFTYNFPVAGTIPIKVQVERIGPGDYDSSNNSLLAEVEVSDTIPLGGVATISYEQRNKNYIADSYFGNTQTIHIEDTVRKNEATVSVQAHTNEAAGGFPFALNAQEINGGSPLFSTTFVLGQASRVTWSDAGFNYVQSCANAYDNSSALTVYLCNEIITSLVTGNSTYLIDLNYLRKPGDVTFHSEGFCTTFDWYYRCQNAYSYYSWNETIGSLSDGFAPVTLNTNYEVKLQLTSSAGASFGADVSVPIDQSSSMRTGSPYQCGETSSGHSCEEALNTLTTVSGSLAF